MKAQHSVSRQAALFCAAGFLFCLWVHVGQVEEACFTAGCSLYQQTSVAGISLWIIGMAAFLVLGLLSLLGRASLALWLVRLGLVCDCFLLALLLITAPCFFCLIFAFLLLCVYLSLRKSLLSRQGGMSREQRRSILLCIWGFFFICNVGIVAKSSVPRWDISDNIEDASVYMYFSPSCSVCRQGVEALSGNIDVAFFPVAESSWDVMRVARMEELLVEGMSMREAFLAAGSAARPSGTDLLAPSMIVLQLKLLFNKAHVFMEGGGRVPFLEYRGLPRHLLEKQKADSRQQRARVPQPVSAPEWEDPTLPLDSEVGGFCTGGRPCADDSAPAPVTP